MHVRAPILNAQLGRPARTLSAYAKCCDNLNIPTALEEG